MLPAVASLASASSSNISERVFFIENLEGWAASPSPYDERLERQRLVSAMIQVFDQNLNSLSFQGGISSLPTCIGNLQSLVSLSLNACINLASLPPEIGKLHNLQTLTLFGCTSLTSLPLEISYLQNLRTLALFWCRSVASLPLELGNLHNLQALRLVSCTSLTSLPPDLGNLQKLEHLFLSGCSGLTSLPPELGNSQNLRILDLSGCNKLGSFPIERIGLTDLYPNEHKEFINTFNRFLFLLQHAKVLENEPTPVQNERLIVQEDSLQPTHATGRFVSSFKDRILARRLSCIEKEVLNVNEAIVSLCEDPSVTELEKGDERGPALPLMVLECFLAPDTRLHFLRLQQERENRLSQALLQ